MVSAEASIVDDVGEIVPAEDIMENYSQSFCLSSQKELIRTVCLSSQKELIRTAHFLVIEARALCCIIKYITLRNTRNKSHM